MINGQKGEVKPIGEIFVVLAPERPKAQIPTRRKGWEEGQKGAKEGKEGEGRERGRAGGNLFLPPAQDGEVKSAGGGGIGNGVPSEMMFGWAWPGSGGWG